MVIFFLFIHFSLVSLCVFFLYWNASVFHCNLHSAHSIRSQSENISIDDSIKHFEIFDLIRAHLVRFFFWFCITLFRGCSVFAAVFFLFCLLTVWIECRPDRLPLISSQFTRFRIDKILNEGEKNWTMFSKNSSRFERNKMKLDHKSINRDA